MIDRGKKKVQEIGVKIEYKVKQILQEIYECNGERWLKEVFPD
jgi:hypothetical protein